MEISVRNHQKKILLNLPQISRIVKTLLVDEKIKAGSLSVVFVTHQKIRAYNQKYLGRNHATDVLAFDHPPFFPPPTTRRVRVKIIEGDIIISTDAAVKNCRRFKTSLAYELVLYIVHGLLHLLGYDDHKPPDSGRMHRQERRIMDFLGKKIAGTILNRRQTSSGPTTSRSRHLQAGRRLEVSMPRASGRSRKGPSAGKK